MKFIFDLLNFIVKVFPLILELLDSYGKKTKKPTSNKKVSQSSSDINFDSVDNVKDDVTNTIL